MRNKNIFNFKISQFRHCTFVQPQYCTFVKNGICGSFVSGTFWIWFCQTLTSIFLFLSLMLSISFSTVSSFGEQRITKRGSIYFHRVANRGGGGGSGGGGGGGGGSSESEERLLLVAAAKEMEGRNDLETPLLLSMVEEGEMKGGMEGEKEGEVERGWQSVAGAAVVPSGERRVGVVEEVVGEEVVVEEEKKKSGRFQNVQDFVVEEEEEEEEEEVNSSI